MMKKQAVKQSVVTVGLIGILLFFIAQHAHAQAVDRTHMNWRSPLNHGAECNSSTLNAAITAVNNGSDNEVITLTRTNRAKAPCTWTFTAAVTTSSQVTLYVPDGVQIDADGNTLTLNGRFIADGTNVFTTTSTVVFGKGAVSYINPLWWGATPNDTTLTNMITAINGASLTALLSVGAWSISNDLVIPSNVVLRVPNGAYFDLASSKTLSCAATNCVEAGDYSITNGTGLFRPLGTMNVKWWGAVGDGVTDDITALNAATAAVIAAADSLYFPEGIYYISASWVINTGFQGANFFSRGRTIITSDVTSPNFTVDVVDSQFVKFELDVSATGTTGGGLRLRHTVGNSNLNNNFKVRVVGAGRSVADPGVLSPANIGILLAEDLGSGANFFNTIEALFVDGFDNDIQVNDGANANHIINPYTADTWYHIVLFGGENDVMGGFGHSTNASDSQCLHIGDNASGFNANRNTIMGYKCEPAGSSARGLFIDTGSQHNQVYMHDNTNLTPTINDQKNVWVVGRAVNFYPSDATRGTNVSDLSVGTTATIENTVNGAGTDKTVTDGNSVDFDFTSSNISNTLLIAVDIFSSGGAGGQHSSYYVWMGGRTFSSNVAGGTATAIFENPSGNMRTQASSFAFSAPSATVIRMTYTADHASNTDDQSIRVRIIASSVEWTIS